jgi:hypothetical protein
VTDFDEEVRSRMRAEAVRTRATAPASTVLRELRPRLRSARRLRRATIGATGVVLIGTFAVALQANLANRSSTRIRPADQSEPSPGVDQRTESSGTDGRAVAPYPAKSAHSGVPAATSAISEPSTSSSAPVPTSPGIGDRPVAPIPGHTPITTTPPDTTTTVSIATAPEPSTPTSISPVAPTWTPYRIDSACGSVDVRFMDDRVELVEVLANAGFAVDVKNDGSETVEVGLHGGNDECELKAHVVSGKLVTSVQGPGSPGSPGYDDDD